MNEGAKQAYLDKMDAQLIEWCAMISAARARIDKRVADVRIDYHNQIEAWAKEDSELRSKMEKLRAAGTDGLEFAKAGAQSIWNEISAQVSAMNQSLEEKKN